jgi:hypothetical protein
MLRLLTLFDDSATTSMTNDLTTPVFLIMIPVTAVTKDSINRLVGHLSGTFVHTLMHNDSESLSVFIISDGSRESLQDMVRSFIGTSAPFHIAENHWFASEGPGPMVRRFPNHLPWKQPK